MTHNLFIVDDHFMLRKGIAAYLEEKTFWRITGTFADSKSCLEELKRAEVAANSNASTESSATQSTTQAASAFPQIIIIDIQLGKESGFKLVSQIKSAFPQIKIVIYSMFDTLGFKLQAKDLGAQGFISKASSDETLVACLNTVKNGGTYYEENDLSIQKELDSIVPFLKENERRVFELVLQGKSNEQIKDELFLGLHTVENYVSYILNISNCKNRKALMNKFCN